MNIFLFSLLVLITLTFSYYIFLYLPFYYSGSTSLSLFLAHSVSISVSFMSICLDILLLLSFSFHLGLFLSSLPYSPFFMHSKSCLHPPPLPFLEVGRGRGGWIKGDLITTGDEFGRLFPKIIPDFQTSLIYQ